MKFTRAVAGIGASLLLAGSFLVAVSTPASAADYDTCVLVEQRDGYSYTCDDAVQKDAIKGRTLAAALFTGKNFTGKRLRIWKLGGPCTRPYDGPEFRAFLPGNNYAPFAENVESIRTFNYCDVSLGTGSNMNSQGSAWIDESPNLNATQKVNWNNRADWFWIS